MLDLILATVCLSQTLYLKKYWQINIFLNNKDRIFKDAIFYPRTQWVNAFNRVRSGQINTFMQLLIGLFLALETLSYNET